MGEGCAVRWGEVGKGCGGGGVRWGKGVLGEGCAGGGVRWGRGMLWEGRVERLQIVHTVCCFV